MLAIIAGSLRFWYTALARLRQGQELIPYQRSECVLGFVDVLGIFVIWFGAQLASGFALLILFGSKALEAPADLFDENVVLLLYLSAAFGIASLVFSIVVLVLRYQTTNSFGLRFNQISKQVMHGIIVFVMLMPPMMLLQWLLSLLVEYDHPILSVLAADPSFVAIFGCWAAAVVAAPLVEEFLFRGVFHHWLERLSVSKLSNNQLFVGGSNVTESDDRVVANGVADYKSIPTAQMVEPYRSVDDPGYDTLNPYQSPNVKSEQPVGAKPATGPKYAYWPILVSSFCFAAIHFGQGLAPIPLFILALGLGYLFRQTGSLIACITVHFLLNFYSMLVFTITLLMGETP